MCFVVQFIEHRSGEPGRLTSVASSSTEADLSALINPSHNQSRGQATERYSAVYPTIQKLSYLLNLWLKLKFKAIIQSMRR